MPNQNNIEKIAQEIIDHFFARGARVARKDYDFLLDKFSAHRQSILDEVERMIPAEVLLDDEWDEEEKELVKKVFGDDPKNLKTPEWMRERRFGKNLMRSEILSKLKSLKDKNQ